MSKVYVINVLINKLRGFDDNGNPIVVTLKEGEFSIPVFASKEAAMKYLDSSPLAGHYNLIIEGEVDHSVIIKD